MQHFAVKDQCREWRRFELHVTVQNKLPSLVVGSIRQSNRHGVRRFSIVVQSEVLIQTILQVFHRTDTQMTRWRRVPTVVSKILFQNNVVDHVGNGDDSCHHARCEHLQKSSQKGANVATVSVVFKGEAKGAFDGVVRLVWQNVVDALCKGFDGKAFLWYECLAQDKQMAFFVMAVPVWFSWIWDMAQGGICFHFAIWPCPHVLVKRRFKAFSNVIRLFFRHKVGVDCFPPRWMMRTPSSKFQTSLFQWTRPMGKPSTRLIQVIQQGQIIIVAVIR
mmetsp:Transcript_16354/g.24937  ORF Transcript_16354/g.24937 Transcript_16354/m.24937 type:complete len:276 (-) Transcript_16354:204-1031(-)